MELDKLLYHINKILPCETAMKHDRIGLQAEASNEVHKILIVYEVTDEVIDECIASCCDTIITFHPLIWAPLTNILLNERVGRLLSKIIKSSINLISLHTTFDAYQYGTSYLLANALQLNICGFLVPDNNMDKCGMGIIGEMSEPIKEEDLLKKVYDICQSPSKYTSGASNIIKKVAIVGGSGTSFINNARQNNCDAFITADITYHIFHAEKNHLMLIDPGHYETELFVKNGIAKLFNDFFVSNNIEYMVSKVNTNPVKYYPNCN